MKKIQTLTVYLGSSGRCRPVFKESAKILGHLIGDHGKTLVYGGMDAGLMGIVANGALESGASVTGIIPKKLKDSERIHPHLSQTILVPDLWERKFKMFKRADAIIGLPGGFGTIDEVLEALYWAHLGSHAKPILLVNTQGYWDDFIAYIKTLPDLAKEHFIIVDTVEDIFPVLSKWTPPTVNGDKENLPHFEKIILETGNDNIIYSDATVKYSYSLATALGLKQLGRHDKHIGILNKDGRFDYFLKWVDTAAKEHFITDKCRLLFNVAKTQDLLNEKLDKQPTVNINLHDEKWGPSETKTHIEIREKP